MATVTAYFPADMSFQNAWYMEIPPLTFSSTSVTVAFGYHEMTMTGTGFSFPASAPPTGTMTGTNYYGLDLNGALALHAATTGLNLNFTTFVNTLHPSGAVATQASYMATMGLMFAAADTFTGSSGDDMLFSFGGNDTLNGNAGNDILEGGAGNDTINGGAGSDTAGYSTATAAVTVNLGLTTAQATGGAGSDTLLAIENLLGSNYNDTLTGNASANDLNGGAGNDILKGGAGDDILNGGTGIDWAYYDTATGVKVDLGLTSTQATGGGGSDILLGIENLRGSNSHDKLTGNAVANSLFGGAGNDILNGSAGNDTLSGGTGRDGLIGGAGSDTFLYSALSDSATSLTRDLILDFTTGTVANVGDKIDLRPLDANTAVAGDQAFSATIRMNASTFTSAGQLREFGGVVYGNTDSNLTTAEIVIDLNGHTNGLVAGNFLL